jgi:cell division protein FtsQ|nr:MAG: cell division protein FtsQ [Actinomycetota bacterium]
MSAAETERDAELRARAEAGAGADTAERAPRRRWRRARPVVLVLLLAAGVVAAATWLVFLSPLLGVERVEVRGNSGIPDEVVRRAAGVATGEPLAAVDLAAVRARVAALPPIESVRVERAWPRTLLIRVRERTPIAVAQSGDRVALVDRFGVVVSLRDTAPEGLPRLRVARVAPDDPAARAALAAVHALPEGLARRVAEVRAEDATSVSLRLADGRTVNWGGAEHGDLKARVLLSLLRYPGRSYDVSSPDVATVR